MTPQEKADRPPLYDPERLAAQLREHVIEPLTSVGFSEAVRKAVNSINDAVAQMQAEEHRRAHPRITDNLPRLHRKYRRQP